MSDTYKKRLLELFDLPPEIRLRILEFTQLNPEVVSTLKYVPICRGRPGIPGEWRRTREPLCSTCAQNTNRNSYCLLRRFGRFQASTRLRTLRCRSIPFSLFAVSKQMRVEAEYIFFKYNGFEFFPSRALDVCGFLKGLSEYKLRMIQNLRFTFSYQQCEAWNDGGRNQWRLLLNWIKYNEFLKDLRLVIDVEGNFICSDSLRLWYGNERISSSYTHGAEPTYRKLYEMVCEIALETVIIREKLQGLHLRLPFYHLLEKPLEQEVMGKDYDMVDGRGSWPTLEERCSWRSSGRLPLWHAIAWEQITERYKKLVYLLKQSEARD